MIALAVASSFEVTRPAAGGIDTTIHVGTGALIAVALIWLPPLLRLISLTGGRFKAAGVEAAAPGLLGSPEELIKRLANISTGAEQLKEKDPKAKEIAESVEMEVRQIATTYLDPAETLTDQALRSLAHQYESIRDTSPAGAARTNQMTRLVNEARVRARAAPEQARRALLDLLRSRQSGDRIVGLALAQEVPTQDALPEILHLVSESSSAFEMYHALLALQRLAHFLAAGQRTQAVAVLEAEKQDPRGKGVMNDAELPGLISQTIRMLGDASSST
jgi:hypothetical protein